MKKNMSLGRYIGLRRKRISMTQEQLADRIHVSKSAVAKWETDRGIPDRDNLYRLAEVLGADITELHRIIGNPDGNKGEGIVNITPEVIATLESHGYRVIAPGENED